MRKTIVQLLFVALAMAPAAIPAQVLPQQDPGEPSAARPGLLGKIGIDQRLNEQVPLDLAFVDDPARPHDIDGLFAVHLKGPFFLTQTLLPLLSDGGHSVAIVERWPAQHVRPIGGTA